MPWTWGAVLPLVAVCGLLRSVMCPLWSQQGSQAPPCPERGRTEEGAGRNCCAVSVQLLSSHRTAEWQTLCLHCWGGNPLSVLTTPFPSSRNNSIFYSPGFLSFPLLFSSGHMGILALSWSTGHYGANKQTLHMGCCFVSAANVCSTVSRNLFEEDMRQE